MTKNWHDVKDEIEKEIDKIWFDEPEEVTMSKMGIFPSGAGVDGQVLGNLFFQACDTQAMGWWTIQPGMMGMLKDPEFTLDHCKKAFKYLDRHMAWLMGEVDPPYCPAPWMNLGKMWKYHKDIEESYDSIKTKEEFVDLLWSWFQYVNRIQRWFHLIFPWHLGKSYPRIEKADAKEIAKLSGLKVS
jgi:hypothetical protein